MDRWAAEFPGLQRSANSWGIKLTLAVYAVWAIFDRLISPDQFLHLLLLRSATFLILLITLLSLERLKISAATSGWIAGVAITGSVSIMVAVVKETMPYEQGMAVAIFGCGIVIFWHPRMHIFFLIAILAMHFLLFFGSGKSIQEMGVAGIFSMKTAGILSWLANALRYRWVLDHYMVRIRLKRTNRRTIKTEEALRRVLDGMQEIFLTVGQNLKTGNIYSKSAADLIPDLRPGMHFLALIPEEHHAQTLDFFETIFMVPTISHRLVEAMNPLKTISLPYSKGHRTHGFQFRPIVEKTGKMQMLVNIIDITEQKEWKKEIQDYARIAEQARGILRTSPHLLREQFLKIQNITKTARRFLHQFMLLESEEESLSDLLRSTHTLKASAAAMNLRSIASGIHSLEAAFLQFKADPDEYLHHAVNELDRLQKLLNSHENMIEEMLGLQMIFEDNGLDSPAIIKIHLAELLQLEAARKGCKAHLVLECNKETIPSADFVFEILVNLVRNAVVHSLEPPDQRVTAGKPPDGLIKIQILADSSSCKVICEDNGQGWNYSRILQRALDMDILQPEQASNLRLHEIRELVLQEGLSTAMDRNEHSGHGLGLSAVAHRVQAHGGKIILSERGNRLGSRIELIFPISDELQPGPKKPTSMRPKSALVTRDCRPL